MFPPADKIWRDYRSLNLVLSTNSVNQHWQFKHPCIEYLYNSLLNWVNNIQYVVNSLINLQIYYNNIHLMSVISTTVHNIYKLTKMTKCQMQRSFTHGLAKSLGNKLIIYNYLNVMRRKEMSRIWDVAHGIWRHKGK